MTRMRDTRASPIVSSSSRAARAASALASSRISRKQDAKVAFLDVDIDAGNDLASVLARACGMPPLFVGCDLVRHRRAAGGNRASPAAASARQACL
jgi:hypothetical protein